MFDEALKAKVNREVGRLNGELHDLHELEERTKTRRARLEVEMRQALAMRDMFELLGRLDKQPPPGFVAKHAPVMPEYPDGPQFVSVASVKAPSAPVVAAVALSSSPALPYAIRFTDAVVQPPRAEDDFKLAAVAPQRKKPDGLPTTPDMIVTVLREAGRPIRPSEIATFIRQRWWAELPAKVVYTNAYRMAKDGRLTAQEGRYSLNGRGHD